jgi:TP901 family phage tail tape measure protein
MAENVQILISAVDKASAVIKSVGSSLSNITKETTLAQKAMTNFSAGIEKTKTILETGIKVGAVATAGALVFAGKTAMDFEKTMSGVSAVLSPTIDEFESLREKAKELGKTTQFSAKESALGIEMLAKNGLNYTAIMEGAIQSTLDLAAATGSDLSSSADLMTDAMANFNIRASETKQAIDGITGVTVASKFTMNDYAYAMANAGGVAGMIGLSFEDFNTVIAGISPAFSSGMDAGTSFKTFLQRLSPISGNAAKEMQRLGFNAFDSAGKLKPMSQISQELQQSLSGLTDEQKQLSLNIMFGSDAIRAAGKIAEMGAEGFDKLQQQIARVSAQEQAITRLNNLSGAITIMKSAIEGLAIDIYDLEIGGQKLIEWIRQGTVAFTNFIAGINLQSAINSLQPFFVLVQSVFNFLSENTKIAEALFMGLAVTIGAFVVPALISMATAFISATAPIIAMIAVGALLYTAWQNNFLGIQDITRIAFDAIINLVSVVFEVFKNFILFFSNVFTGNWAGAWENVKNIFTGVFEAILIVLGTFWETLKAIMSAGWQVVKDIFNASLSFLYSLFEGMLLFLTEIFANMFLILTGQWGKVWENIMEATGTSTEAVVNKVKGWIKSVADFFSTDGLKIIYDGAVAMFSGMIDAILNVGKILMDKVRGTISSVVTTFAGAIGANQSAGANARVARKQFGGFVDKVQYFASGGIVQGQSGIDKVPAMLSAGEVVLNAGQQRNVARRLQADNKEVVINVNGNNFYGNDKEFASKIGDIIMKEFVKHTAFESF